MVFFLKMFVKDSKHFHLFFLVCYYVFLFDHSEYYLIIIFIVLILRLDICKTLLIKL
jgi:hypothetical protein